MAITEICTVISLKQLNDTCFDMILDAPKLSEMAKPGQFVSILCGHSRTLRRPISICDAIPGTLRLVFEIRGEGTAYLAKRKVGDKLDVLGTLGCGTFPILDDDRPVLLIGGGIGAPPLLYTAKAQKKAHAVLGFRNEAAIILKNEFYNACENLMIATDDGSFGAKGTIEAPARLLLEKNEYSAILACGPKPMLKAAQKLAEEFNTPCWLSMEERMGCGIGACLVCACKTKDENGEEKFSHVCKDGPVFPSEYMVW